MPLAKIRPNTKTRFADHAPEDSDDAQSNLSVSVDEDEETASVDSQDSLTYKKNKIAGITDVSAEKVRGDEHSDDPAEYRIKVYKVSGGQDRSPVTIIQLESPNYKSFSRTPFGAIRSRIAKFVKSSFSFCDDEGAFLQDEQSLSLVLEDQGAATNKRGVYEVYIKSSTTDTTSDGDERISTHNGPYVLKLIQLLGDNDKQSEGTIHSSSLKGATLERLHLSSIRKLTKSMSLDPEIHKFCLSDGHTVQDGITLEDYVSMEEFEDIESSHKTRVISIYFTKHDTFRASRLKGADPAVLDKLNELGLKKEFTRDLSAPEIQRNDLNYDSKINDLVAQGSSTGEAVSAGKLSENEWELVLRNCNVMYGWVVDVKNHKIIRAPKPAFQLRPGLNIPGMPESIELPKVQKKPKAGKNKHQHHDATPRRAPLERPPSLSRPHGSLRKPILKPVASQDISDEESDAGSTTLSDTAVSASGSERHAVQHSINSDEDEEDSTVEDDDDDEEKATGSEESISADDATEHDSESEEDVATEETESDDEIKTPSENGSDAGDEMMRQLMRAAQLSKGHGLPQTQTVLKKKVPGGTMKLVVSCQLEPSDSEASGSEADPSEQEESEEESEDDQSEAQSVEQSEEESEEGSEGESEGEEGSIKSHSAVERRGVRADEAEEVTSEDELASQGESAVEASDDDEHHEPIRGDAKHARSSRQDPTVASVKSSNTVSRVAQGEQNEEVDVQEEEDDDDDDEDDVEGRTISVPRRAAASIPNFTVDDRSKVEVVSVSSEFHRSLATNHFSSTSASVEGSGGWGGVSVAASASAGHESKGDESQTQNGRNEMVIASYKFPRATIYLNSADLVPTQDLKDAIERVRRTKNINDLKKLHAEFGHFFSQQVVVGGCLQSTKNITVTETSSSRTQAEQFRASVGIAVQSSMGAGMSAKVEHEQGSGSASKNENSEASESIVFEATGGDTLLASSPQEWIGSVMDSGNWRVIEQSGLIPMTTVIGEIPSYAQVPEWFMRAIPALSRYITIPKSRVLDVRFKACLEEEGIGRTMWGSKIQSYLSHNPNPAKAVWPVRMGLKHTSFNTMNSQVERWEGSYLIRNMLCDFEQVDVQDLRGLFSPARTQAPVLIHFNTTFDKLGDEQHKQTTWGLEVPEGQTLTHGCRVAIKSSRVALTVYRNQQGVFLPAMTSDEGPSYWRLLKNSPNARYGEPMRDGEVVRLCWRFADQAGGFRDFRDDSFGRRRFTKPAEVEADALYLKVPFPRFERSDSDNGMALVMSTASTAEPVIETIKVLPLKGEEGPVEPELSYNLHDLSFRIDTVAQGESGPGDSDYMIAGMNQSNDSNIVTVDHWQQTVARYDITPPPPPAPLEWIADAVMDVVVGSGFMSMVKSFLW